MDDQIRFFALGGLGENGKNMYAFDVNNQVFIIDAGLKYPGGEHIGIDEIIPEYKMLIRARARIKGIFISHAHEEHIGALSYILKDLNVPVFGSRFTIDIIKASLSSAGLNINDYTLNNVVEDTVLEFDNIKVSFFNVSHTIPGNYGVCIHTPNGALVYTSNYNFLQSNNKDYETNISKLSDISKEGVLMLLTESVGSLNYSNDTNLLLFNNRLNSIFMSSNHRIIIPMYSSDFKKIGTIVDLAKQFHRRIAIVGEKGKKAIEVAASLGYLNINKNDIVTLEPLTVSKNNYEDLVILITGTRDEPFFMVQNIIEKNDKYLEFYKTDNVIVLTPTVVGNEKISARTIDLLYRTDATINVINKSLFIDSHATIEEIKMMINILKPKYIIPVIGEYRHQYSLKNIAIDLNYSPEYVLIMENGDVFNINKNSSYLSKGDITTGEILIDGTPIDFSYDFVIRDRTLLAEDGALVIVAYVNPQTKQIVGPVDIITKGFVYVKGSEAILNGIRSIFYSASAKHLDKKYINWIEYKKDIRDTIGKYIFQETRRKPILIPDIISLENVPKNEEKN